MRLLIVENDLVLLDLLLASLLKSYLVDVASNLLKVQNLIEDNFYQVILLSSFIFENDQSRSQVSRIFRNSQSPILLMTSGELSKQDFSFLGHRSIDFLHKPFNMNELNLRLKLVLFKLPMKGQELLLNDQKLSLNNQTHSLSFAKNTIFLSKKEFYLLQLFFKRPNQLLSKSLLANLVWDKEEVVYGNTIATHVSSLRRKIKHLSGREPIRTVRGDGYLLKDLE